MHVFERKHYEPSSVHSKDLDDALGYPSPSLFLQVNLFKCQVGLNANHYSALVECLQDYYAEVRLAACEALFLLAIHSPERYDIRSVGYSQKSVLHPLLARFRPILPVKNHQN